MKAPSFDTFKTAAMLVMTVILLFKTHQCRQLQRMADASFQQATDAMIQAELWRNLVTNRLPELRREIDSWKADWK